MSFSFNISKILYINHKINLILPGIGTIPASMSILARNVPSKERKRAENADTGRSGSGKNCSVRYCGKIFPNSSYKEVGILIALKSGPPTFYRLGDCFSYALAAVKGGPLPYKGTDFALTDL
jgi:hypothetical protein